MNGDMEKLSESSQRLILDVALKLYEEVTAIPRPYEPHHLARLSTDQQEKVQAAEIPAYLSVKLGWSRTHIPGLKERSQQFNAEYGIEPGGDKTWIDEPLERMRALARTYAETGLAADEAEAKRMAEGFKNAIVHHCQQKSGKRGK